MSFGRHVNFITGSNGSGNSLDIHRCIIIALNSYYCPLGKSAIVSAIQLCLGATAKVTGRGTNLSGFVMEGTDGPAIAQVTLMNEGDDAYKPEIYGKRIVIERRITKAGVSGYGTYALKDNRLSVVSSQKAEVDSILKYFNIYVDNPCCVLTQEEAKKFIQGEDKDKYEFYLKASGLHRTKEELLAIKTLLQEAIDKKEKCVKALDLKRAENQKLKDDVDLWNNFDNEELKVNHLKAKRVWADVYISEKRLNASKGELNEIQGNVDELQEIVNKLESDCQAKGNFDAINEAISDINARQVDLNEEQARKSAAMKETTNRLNSAKAETGKYESMKRENSDRLKVVVKEVCGL